MVVSNAAQQALHRTSTVKTSMTKSVEPEPLRRANTEKSSKKKDSLQVTNSINLHGSSDTVHQAISTDLSVASKRGTKSLMSEVNGYLRERSENPRLMKLKMQCQNGEGSQSHMPEIQLTDMERELPLIEPSGQKAPVPDSGHLKTPKARSRRESLSVMECESIDTNHITITRQAGNVEERLSPLLLAAKLANQVQSQKRSTPLARFRSYARSVLIFLQWFKYLGRNLKVRVEWDWAWDPRSYVEYNPFAKKDQSALTRDMHDFASSLKTVKYNGVMVDVVRNILRKEPRKRTSSELDSLTTFFSTMKAFEKYDLETRRLFVANGRYGRWDAGRHIIKERHPAESFYIVLEGQIEIWLLDKRFYDAKDTSVADYSKSLDDNFDPMHKVTIAKLGGGAAFGEVAFTQAKDKKRGACVSTLKETEFLYIENKDAKSILKVNTDKSLIEKTECIESIPLLKTLRIDAKTLAYYSTLKVVGVDTPIITEGEKSDFLYIIK